MKRHKKNGISHCDLPFFCTYISMNSFITSEIPTNIWGIERSGFFNGREKWAKGFENQRV